MSTPAKERRDDIIIRFRDVRKTFGEKKVHRGIDLSVRRGETLTILGGSGTGKSVLLKELIGLMKPDAGEVLIDGADVVPMKERDLLAIRRRVGMLFQGAALFDSLTVAENVAYPLLEHFDMDGEALAGKVREKLELVGLDGTQDLMPEDLSGGMKKRVGLARAISTDPEIVLYDEPTTGLDPTNVKKINRLIRKLQEVQGVTSLVVTHDLDSAFAVSDRMAVLHKGRIAAVGTGAELESSEDDFVRQFLAGEAEY